MPRGSRLILDPRRSDNAERSRAHFEKIARAQAIQGAFLGVAGFLTFLILVIALMVSL